MCRSLLLHGGGKIKGKKTKSFPWNRQLTFVNTGHEVVNPAFEIKIVLLMSHLSFQAHGQVTSSPPVVWGKHALLISTCGGLEGPKGRELASAVSQKRHEHWGWLRNNEHLSNLPTHLCMARACMKMWCFVKRDTAIKWREYARCQVAFPSGRVAHGIFGATPEGRHRS